MEYEYDMYRIVVTRPPDFALAVMKLPQTKKKVKGYNEGTDRNSGGRGWCRNAEKRYSTGAGEDKKEQITLV